MSHARRLLYRGRGLIVSQAEAWLSPWSPMLSTLDKAAQGLPRRGGRPCRRRKRQPNPQLTWMLVGVLRTIATSPSSLNVAAVDLKLLANEGMRPELDRRVRCGETEPDTQLTHSI